VHTWHLPTSKEPLTAEQFVRLACELAGQPCKLQVAPRWMLKLFGPFMPVLRENEEMTYQFDYDYRFDSNKIESAFGIQPTSYMRGYRNMFEIINMTSSGKVPPDQDLQRTRRWARR
jgi:hypothetical protein